MAKISVSSNYPVSPDAVFETVGAFGGIHKWHPAVTKTEIETEGNKTLRRLSLAGGGTILERLDKEANGSYTYSILESPLPVKNYTATISVRPAAGGGSTVEWSSEFDTDGTPESDAAEAIQGIYQAGIDNLRKMFGG